MTINLVLIQHAHDTGRYHPAYYTPAPFPGPGPDPALRYKSRGHHTFGFEGLEEAIRHAHELGEQVSGRVDVEHLREMDEAGPDIVLRDTR